MVAVVYFVIQLHFIQKKHMYNVLLICLAVQRYGLKDRGIEAVAEGQGWLGRGTVTAGAAFIQP